MLKYLFEAEFLDGTRYRQSDKDEQGKSAFADHVLNYPSPVIRFTLRSAEAEYSIDLLTLNFCAGGHEFRLHNERELPLKGQQVYYTRTVMQQLNVTGTVQNDLTLQPTSFEPQESKVLHYTLGWTAKDKDGNDIKRVIEFE